MLSSISSPLSHVTSADFGALTYHHHLTPSLVPGSCRFQAPNNPPLCKWYLPEWHKWYSIAPQPPQFRWMQLIIPQNVCNHFENVSGEGWVPLEHAMALVDGGLPYVWLRNLSKAARNWSCILNSHDLQSHLSMSLEHPRLQRNNMNQCILLMVLPRSTLDIDAPKNPGD